MHIMYFKIREYATLININRQMYMWKNYVCVRRILCAFWVNFVVYACFFFSLIENASIKTKTKKCFNII